VTVLWQPACSLDLIRLRAKLLHEIRCFFYARNVLEVETPILCQSIGTDPYIDFFSTSTAAILDGSIDNHCLYLQTSPEFAMKRLLAANVGSIYQISKVFRKGESGRFHNPEFTLLEWYRTGFDLAQLMDEVEQLLKQLLPFEQFSAQAQRVTYSDVFRQYTGLDALAFDQAQYQSAAEKLGFPEAIGVCANDHVTWLDFLFSHSVQPHLGNAGVCMIYDYPACLPSLARLNSNDARIVERVEVFIHGIELGNGYYELTDTDQQRARFEQEILLRNSNGAQKVNVDERFLGALRSGLPDCSGIALGLDRLLMIISQKSHIDEVLAFPVSNA